MNISSAKSCAEKNRTSLETLAIFGTASLLMLLPSLGGAENWLDIGQTDQAAFAYDQDSARRVGSFIEIRTRMSSDKALRFMDKKYQSSEDKLQLDCARNRYRVLTSVLFSEPYGKGQIVASRDKPLEWQVLTSDGIAGLLVKEYC